MNKPEKLTKSVFKEDAPPPAQRPPLVIADCVLAIERHRDGSCDLTLVHGGQNLRIPLTDAQRRALGRLLLEPDPECVTCSAPREWPGEAGRASEFDDADAKNFQSALNAARGELERTPPDEVADWLRHASEKLNDELQRSHPGFPPASFVLSGIDGKWHLASGGYTCPHCGQYWTWQGVDTGGTCPRCGRHVASERENVRRFNLGDETSPAGRVMHGPPGGSMAGAGGDISRARLDAFGEALKLCRPLTRDELINDINWSALRAALGDDETSPS